jgi:chemotaxis protein histidine kinase CheA
MVAEQTRPDISWQGSDSEQETARRAFDLIRAKGMFASDYAPIRVQLDALAGALDTDAGTLRAALDANLGVFAIEDREEQTWVVSTRLGQPPIEMLVDTRHSFQERLLTPEPAPERPLRAEKPVPAVVYQTEVDEALEEAAEEEQEVDAELRAEGFQIDETVTVAFATAEEREAARAAREAAAAARQAAAEEAEAAAKPERAAVVEPEVVEEPVAEEAIAEPEIAPEPEEEAVEEPVVEEAVAEPEPEVAPEPVAEVVAEPEVVPEPEPEAPVVEAPKAPVVALTDLSTYDDAAVAAAISEALHADGRFAHFGDRWMADDQVDRLSRGNLRSLADYINEQEQPLTDDVLVQDVLGVRRSASNFAAARFSINYRLSSERNFEFLGTRDQPYWGTTDLPSIGTTRRKASDIGTDYRFLVDEVPEGSVAPRSVTSVEHTLSFYEFTYGLLPLDATMQALLPTPVMPDQRSAVLMVEIPQFENSVYLVEVRYPTHNRGGFILGLDDFYEEKLVPGAMLSISATDNDGQYKIEYLEDKEQQDRFLELDDRRSPKYVFRPLSYDTAVDRDWLVTEDRFPRLGNEKPLADKQRRHVEQVVEATFQRIGEDDDGKLIASITDILVVANVERPVSEELLRSAIAGMASVTDDGSGILTYDPSA